jgi:hypothetical protein
LQFDPNYIAVLPEKPKVEEISGLANVSRMIGSLTTKFDVNVKVNTDPKMDTSKLKNANVLIIGKPSRNPLIQTINNDLPQPFVPGEDNFTLQEKIGAYRIEQTIGSGVVQSLTSPWDQTKNITVISGTNDDGMQWSLLRISNSRTIFDFTGELNFVQADRVEAFRSSIPPVLSPEKVISEITGQGASLQPVVPTQVGQQPAPVASQQSGGIVQNSQDDQYVSTKQNTPMIGFGSHAINGYFVIFGIIIIAILIAAFSIMHTIRGGRKR